MALCRQDVFRHGNPGRFDPEAFRQKTPSDINDRRLEPRAADVDGEDPGDG